MRTLIRYAGRLTRGLWSVLTGMAITFRHMVSPTVTMHYPDERWVPPVTFRGVPALLGGASGELRCIGCKACERACPTAAIKVDTEVQTGADGKKRVFMQDYVLDLGRCIACGLCAEACQHEALTMANNYELAEYGRAQLMLDKARLAEFGLGCTYNNQRELPCGFGEGHVVKVHPAGKVAPGAGAPVPVSPAAAQERGVS